VFLNRLGQTVERIGERCTSSHSKYSLSEQQAFLPALCASEMAAAAAGGLLRHFHTCLNAVIKADETEKLAMDGEGQNQDRKDALRL